MKCSEDANLAGQAGLWLDFEN